MQVLGDLIRLPENSDLPIPWWHRAPLGLQTGTWCFVALVESQKRPVPDLLVSVLDPSSWSHVTRIRCQHLDEPGVISKAVGAVHDLNIALAESATLQSGELHEVTLFCEPPKSNGKIPTSATIKRRLVQAGFTSVAIDTFDPLPVLWQGTGELTGGWLHGVEWRSEVAKHLKVGSESIDLGRAVVSADTTSRFARYVFPFSHARTVYVDHRDEPGVLKQITDVLLECRFNILSQLLRRGGAKPQQAVLVAVCEPLPKVDAKDAIKAAIRRLAELPPRLMISVRHHSGMKAENTTTPKEPNTVVARVPSGLVEKVRREKSYIEPRKLAVFFSHRFVSDGRAATLSAHVRSALTENGCHLLEASPDDDVRGPQLIYDEVSAKMWVADAGIVLIADVNKTDPLGPMGKNLPHELGFLLGQGKPVLVLRDGKLEGTQPLGTNLDGVFTPRVPADESAFRSDSPDSIAGIIRKWVRRVRESRSADK